MKPLAPPQSAIDSLHDEIKQLVEAARTRAAAQVNQALVLTYWQIGKLIKTQLLETDRAQYGAGVLQQLATRLSSDFGQGFSYSSLTRMAKFYVFLPTSEIVATLSQQLSWSHFVELIKHDEPVKRDFYINLCVNGRWSVRTLRERTDGMLFERTAIAKQPADVVSNALTAKDGSNTVTPQLFLKDPYLLDFLELQQNFSEKDLENAILADLERFILELGSDFAFMNRQKRIQVGGNDYYIDLLFYNRKLKRLVLIELKLGDYKPEYKGQVELYLKWLAKYEQQPDELSPIAIILCGGKDAELVELMDLEPDGIHIAEYWLKLPPKTVLQAKLHKAMEQAKRRFDLQHHSTDTLD